VINIQKNHAAWQGQPCGEQKENEDLSVFLGENGKTNRRKRQVFPTGTLLFGGSH
jgi:hypothetical protein